MKKFLITFLFLAIPIFAAPDCSYELTIQNVNGIHDNVTIFQPGPTRPLNNQVQACTSWIFSYDVVGFTALAIQLESAQGTNLYAVPGTFSVFGGTTVGSNPSSSLIPTNISFVGFYPWLRVNILSYTGTGQINVKLLGWKSPNFFPY